MKRVNTIILLILLVGGLSALAGCGTGGGAKVNLQGVSWGRVAMEGKPISGLPSDTIDLLLDVSAQEVRVNLTTDNSSAEVTILTLLPSGATIEIRAGGVVMKGFKPEQVKPQWATATGSKPD